MRSGARDRRQADARADRRDLHRSGRGRAVSPAHAGRRGRGQLLAVPPDPARHMTGGNPTVDGDIELRLVERLQAGDATALEGLMERYSSRLYRLAFGITRNARDAEEVLQDVFLTVFRKIGSFEQRAKLGTWLYRVATNTALNKRRGLAATVEVALDDLLPTYLDDGHRAGDRSFLLTDWSETPEEELLAGEGGRRWTGPWPCCPTAIAPCSSCATSMGCRPRRPPTRSANRCPR